MNVIDDGAGEEEVEGEALADAFADVGGGDFDEGGVEELEACGDDRAEVFLHGVEPDLEGVWYGFGRFWNGFGRLWGRFGRALGRCWGNCGGGLEGVRGGIWEVGRRRPAEDGEVDEVDKFANAMPGVECGELVGAEEEGVGVGGVFGAEGFDGVDGVARRAGAFAAVEFAGVGEEVSVVGEGEVEHVEAVFGAGASAVGFVGGDVGGDEEDFVGVEDFAGAQGGEEVGVVDGVEGSAVDEGVHERDRG